MSGVQLPQSANVFLPIIPKSIKSLSPELNTYLFALEGVLKRAFVGEFNNVNNIAVALNSGTSGLFNVASGGHILVTSGVVISVSTT